MSDLERTTQSFKSVSAVEFNEITRPPTTRPQFMSVEDMRRFKNAVRKREESFRGTRKVDFTLTYHTKNKFLKVWIQPIHGYVPCGEFDVIELGRKEG